MVRPYHDVADRQEYEIIAGTRASDACGSAGSVAVRHGRASTGVLVGMVQVRVFSRLESGPPFAVRFRAILLSLLGHFSLLVVGASPAVWRPRVVS